MDVAVTAAHRFMRMKIKEVAETKGGKRDAMGVLLYGCDPNRAMRDTGSPKSSGSGDDDSGEEREELPATEELIELHPPGGEQVRNIQECLPPDEIHQMQRNLRKEYSRGKSEVVSVEDEDEDDMVCNILQGLTAAMKIFANSK